MPWINLTLRKGTFTKEVQHAVTGRPIVENGPVTKLLQMLCTSSCATLGGRVGEVFYGSPWY
jgi:hypothetical protein